MENLGSNWAEFHENFYEIFVENLSKKIPGFIKKGNKITGTLYF